MAKISRRTFLIGTGAAAGLGIAWAVWPRDYDFEPYKNGQNAVFNSWLSIARNGMVIISVPLCEMGQGIGTILAQIIAEELGADWRTIAIIPAQPEAVFANRTLLADWIAMVTPTALPNMLIPQQDNFLLERLAEYRGFVVTAGDSEIAQYEQPLREAAAHARMLLCAAAAKKWGVEAEHCTTDQGYVAHDNKNMPFAELIDDALLMDAPQQLELKASLPGYLPVEQMNDAPVFNRLDLPSKVDGTANFAGDIRLPDMVYAAIRHGPIGDSRLKNVDTAPIKNSPGVIDTVVHDRWVACVASNWWAANNALAQLKPVFETRGILVSSERIENALDDALKAEGRRLFVKGEMAAFDTESTAQDEQQEAQTGRQYAHYSIAPALHATIETNNATARFKNGRLELWMASQSPEQARRKAADALGIATTKVVIYPLMAGGSFDIRLENDIATEVALLARHMKRPVQLRWSRGEEMIHDFVRTPAMASVTAELNKDNKIKAMQVKLACPPTNREFGQRLFFDSSAHEAVKDTRKQADPMAVSGAVPPYNIPNWAVDHHSADIGLPTGRWRGNAHSYGVFIIESFIDEMARISGREPMSYRMEMLNNNIRLANCLTRVTQRAGWDGGLDNSGMGLACAEINGGYIAVVARARRQNNQSGIRVDALTACVDIGRVVNKDIAFQQIEGGMIFGMAQAMGSAASYHNGLNEKRVLRELALPVMADTPLIDIEFIDSDEPPAGMGELGVPAVAPAIANALFSATGLRMRQMPLISSGL